jgi:ABC-type dipeptide/oligopeptide/nickel transport system permease subunit
MSKLPLTTSDQGALNTEGAARAPGLPTTTSLAGATSKPAPVRSLWRDAFRRLLRNRLAVAGLVIVIISYTIAIVGPYITPYDYLAQNLLEIAEPPSAAHWLGTDDVGRDYLSRLLYAMRTAVLVSILVPSLSLAIGVTLGAIAAFRGGWLDGVIMRITDVVMTIPLLLFAALINVAVKEPVGRVFNNLYMRTGWGFLTNTIYLDYLIVFGALSVIMWAGYARLIRGQILSLREVDYVLAARALGARPKQIIVKHLIPNAMGPVIVSFTFGMSGAMILEASLSYLGIGIQPPGASLAPISSLDRHPCGCARCDHPGRELPGRWAE